MTEAAYEINGQRVSPAAFYTVACDPRRSVAVEACAGAGKTWMLVSRMLRALLDGAAPQDILAITFTKKAAGEMRERLYSWLADFAGKDDAALAQELRIRGLAAPDATQVAALRGLQRRLLAQGRSVQVRTFHSWFAALLQSAPWAALRELGLPASFELLENDAEAVAKVWRVFLASVQADEALRQDYLASVQAVGRFNTHKALEKALEKRVEFQLADAAGTLEPSVQPVGAVFAAYAGLPDPQQRLQTPAAQALLWQAARVLGASTLKSMSERGAALEQALTAQDWPGVVDALMTQKGEPRKLNDKVVGVEDARAAQAMLAEHAQALHQHQCWQHHQRMVRLTRQMVQDFSELKRERGWIDMGDLERTALALLSDPVLGSWVQERLDAQVRHLLIDEFQDTNPLQWQALHAWLESYGGAGSAPSVFIVGDPKQSIYRFRRAEPQVFRAAQRFVREGLGGDLLSCDHTRRNAPEVIAAVNASMAQAQAAGQMPGFRPHTTDCSAPGAVLALTPIPRGPASSASEGDTAQTPVEQWRDSLTTPRETVEESRKRQECAQVLRWLAPQLRSGELQPHEVMVLARRRATLGVMQELLSAAGVPSVQPEKTDLSESPTVQDVTALLDALVSPWHDLSTARALKSPLLGLDDADLVELALQVRARTAAAPEDLSARHWLPCLWALAASEAPEANLERLAQAGRTLRRWQAWVAERNVHAALAAILDDANARERYAGSVPQALRETVLAELHAVQQAALAVDGGRFLSAYALVRALRRPGQQAPLRADSQALRLLTVHGAKGLEAKLVILLDTDGEAARKDSMGVLLDWPGEAAHPQRFAFLLGESRPSQCLQQAMEAELREREREEVNGLYVALTRAQCTLLLSSMAPRTANPASWWARLQGLVTPVQASDEALQAAGVESAEFAWFYLEKTAVTQVDIAQTATNSVATVAVAPVQAESLESRMGQAMHRLLEWVAPRPGGVAAGAMPWSDNQRRSVQESFALEGSQMASVLRAATGILCGQGAWVWNAAALSWQGSEVPLVAQGRLLRLDRLVQHRESGAWWVLDYKSTATPLQQPELCAQLAQYRTAVGLATPGATVRAAFLTPDGQLQEWRADAAPR